MPLSQENQFDAWLALTGQTPPPTEPVWLPMLSGSMAPAIPLGTWLRIVVDANHCSRTGEVVIFEVDGKLVAHRILMVLRLGSWTRILEKGDANPLGTWRSASLIRGWVAGVAPDTDEPVTIPTNHELARRGLRTHLRQSLLNLARRRPLSTSEETHDK